LIRRRACSHYAIVAVAVVCATPGAAAAQAWVAPGGLGAINVIYQTIANTGHRLDDGTMLRGFDSASRGLLFEFEYAITDRLSVTAGVPYLGAKYQGPEPSLFLLPTDECLCWQTGWQDLNVTARYNIFNDTFALTPSVAFGSPTNSYNYFGEAVVGRNLNEVRIAVDTGYRLDAISPRLSVSGRYSYAFVEEVLDIPNNRSNISVETSYLITRQIGARFVMSWQRSHGGLRSTEFDSEEEFVQFDRLLKDNYFHLGGAVAYSFPRIDVFAAYVGYVSGTDTHAGRVFTVGMSYPFQLR
jgi:hypothetical protein